MKKNLIYFIIVFFTIFSCKKEDSIIGWEEQTNNSINNVSLNYLAISESNIYAVTDNLKNTLYKSVDGGVNWTEVNSIPKSVNSITLWNQYVFAGTSSGIFRSTDNGVTWTAINKGLSLFYGALQTGVPFVCNNKIYAYYGYEGDVYVTENNGDSWSCVSESLSQGIDAFNIIGSNLIAANGNGIYHSVDGSATWTAAAKNVTHTKNLAVSGTSIVAGTTDGLYYSTDNGVNWTKAKITDVDYQYPGIECFAVSGSNIYAGTQKYGIYFSSDKGISWSKFNTGFTDVPTCYSLFVSGGYLYAQTSRGLWKYLL
jgi:photosystem II stability/assembly factor-like uncharacterized protein